MNNLLHILFFLISFHFVISAQDSITTDLCVKEIQFEELIGDWVIDSTDDVILNARELINSMCQRAQSSQVSSQSIFHILMYSELSTFSYSSPHNETRAKHDL